MSHPPNTLRIVEVFESDVLRRLNDDPVPDFWAISHVPQWGLVLMADAKSGEVRRFTEGARRVLEEPLFRFPNVKSAGCPAPGGRAKAVLLMPLKTSAGEDVLLLGGAFTGGERWTNCILSLAGSLESGWKEVSRQQFTGERSSAIALCSFSIGARALCVCCVEGSREAHLLSVPQLESVAKLPLPEQVIFAALDGDLLAASFTDHSLRLFRLRVADDGGHPDSPSPSLKELSIEKNLLIQYRILWRDGFLLVGVRDWTSVRDDVVCFSLGDSNRKQEHSRSEDSVRLVKSSELLEPGVRLLIDCWCTWGEKILAWDWNRKELVAIALI